MVKELHIEGFRCFDRFHIDGLQRINLIGGKNSTGKSSLLEAMQFFLQPDIRSLAELLDWRDQLVSNRQIPGWTEETVDPLFHRGNESKAFVLSAQGRAVQCRMTSHRLDGNGNWVEAQEPLNGGPAKPVLRVESVQSGDKRHFFVALDGSVEFDSPHQSALRASESFLRYTRLDQKRLIHARAGAYDSSSLSTMLEKILGTPREEGLLRVLRWIVPRATRIFTKGQGEQRSIYVRSGEFAAPQPLAAFGDGAVRLTGIVLSTVLASGGCCLIDEIENGLHYSVVQQLWPLLNQFSSELGVQILATTHSKDCLDGFAGASGAPDFDGAFFRLERSGDGALRPVRLDYERFFSKMADTPYEVR